MSRGPGAKSPRLLVATRSQHKLAELVVLLDLPHAALVDLDELGIADEAIEDGATLRQNAILKARFYGGLAGVPTLADDSGVEVDALDGAPGVWTRRYAGPNATDEDNNARLLAVLADVPNGRRTARYRCVLAYFDGAQVTTRSGVFEGRIALRARGSSGFGYDPIFEPAAEPVGGRTVAQLSADEKNRVSHRARAARAMSQHLRTLGY